jgi:tricorn protease
VPPDVDIELDPAAWRKGHDAQLEKAIEVVMQDLEKNPPQPVKHPAYPDYSKYSTAH